jgi:hypothetical protein
VSSEEKADARAARVVVNRSLQHQARLSQRSNNQVKMIILSTDDLEESSKFYAETLVFYKSLPQT